MSSDISKTVVKGRLTKDCEFGYVKLGSAQAKFSIACNRSVKKNDEWIDEADFYNCVIWGKKAESLKAYLTKGKAVLLEGRFIQNRWQDNEGKNRTSYYLNVEDINFLSSGKSDGSAQVDVVQPVSTGMDDEFPEDIPF